MQKKKRVKDPAYIEYIRSIPCIVCLLKGLESASEDHHVNEKGKGSMGSKTDDRRAIPLCHPHHAEFHDTGRETFSKKYDLDYEYIIQKFNNIYDKLGG